MEVVSYILIGIAVVVAVVMMLALLRAERTRAETAAHLVALGQTAERLAQAHGDLAARLGQVQTAVNERMDSLGKRLGDGLGEQTQRTGETLRVLHERLAVIDAAQKNLTDLSRQVVGLQDILANKQARGEFGEIRLNDLVTDALPPSAYEFQARLGNGRVADCLLHFPNPPGAIAIDSKFPLEAYQAFHAAEDDAARIQAGKAMASDVAKHIRDIAERYIVPGETAESALMFLPSEAVYAELHANFRGVIEESHRRRVWIVSPTTLWATLNTMRAVLKDARMREQAHLIQDEVLKMAGDVGRLDDRVAKLQNHFGQATEDVRTIRISTDKILRRAEKIEEVQMGEGAEEATALPADGSKRPD